MNPTLYELLTGSFIALSSAVIGAIWIKAERAERLAESNRVTLEHFSASRDKIADLMERLSSLEASFNAEIKNLSFTIKRLESAVLRIYHDGRTSNE